MDSAQCGDRDGDGYGDNPAVRMEIGSLMTPPSGGMEMEMGLGTTLKQLRYLSYDVRDHEYRRSAWMS